MGIRAALRTVQDAEGAGRGSVVAAIAEADGESRLIGAPAVAVSAPTEWVEKISAWIPAESIAVFLTLGGTAIAASGTAKELVLVGFIVVLTGLSAAVSTLQAHRRRKTACQVRKAVSAAIVSMIAFLVWWVALPGTAPMADWHVDPFYTSIFLFAGVIGVPYLAQALRLDPLTKAKTADSATPPPKSALTNAE
jgi:hypothetical protein